jgi:hypothetical protein
MGYRGKVLQGTPIRSGPGPDGHRKAIASPASSDTGKAPRIPKGPEGAKTAGEAFNHMIKHGGPLK